MHSRKLRRADAPAVRLGIRSSRMAGPARGRIATVVTVGLSVERCPVEKVADQPHRWIAGRISPLVDLSLTVSPDSLDGYRTPEDHPAVGVYTEMRR